MQRTHKGLLGTAPVQSLFFLIMIFSISPQAARAGGVWLQAQEPRTWHFPRDHGAHPEYQTEWWYYTGNLLDTAGRRYGYQLTFFRFGVNQDADTLANPWQLRDIYTAHAAITMEEGKTFCFKERVSREGPGLAGTRTDRMEIWLFNWSAGMRDGAILLEAYDAGLEIKLTLQPLKPPVLHGEGGLSRKGSVPGQASYYSSLTRLETRGTLRAGADNTPLSVTGLSWYDHEFGSNQLAPGQEGWDWFSLHLSDGRELMLYMIRKADGAVEEFSSGTLVEADGTWRHLRLSDFTVRVLKRWDSLQSGARYPARWQMRIPSAQIELLVTPLISNQELITGRSTGIIYWEGAVNAAGISQDAPITGQGYAELTGYAGSMGGIF